jgi:hypothetical protein
MSLLSPSGINSFEDVTFDYLRIVLQNINVAKRNLQCSAQNGNNIAIKNLTRSTTCTAQLTVSKFQFLLHASPSAIERLYVSMFPFSLQFRRKAEKY